MSVVMVIVMVVSILVLTAVMVGINATRILPWGICAICAGVSGTWAWMLLGMLTGKLPITSYQLPAAILMGGSVVGIAYQLEDRVRQSRFVFAWKVGFMTVGFALVAAVIGRAWGIAGALLVTELGIVWWFLLSPAIPAVRPTQPRETRIAEIEKQMEKCC